MAVHLTLRYPDEWSNSWRERAACRGLARNEGTFHAFFPERGENITSVARGLCMICPVKLCCLDFALTNNIKQGVWGGKTDSQRRTIRRNWARQRSTFLQEMAPVLDEVSVILADG